MKTRPVWAAVAMEGALRGGSSWDGQALGGQQDRSLTPATLQEVCGGAQHFLTCHCPLTLVCLAIPCTHLLLTGLNLTHSAAQLSCGPLPHLLPCHLC